MTPTLAALVRQAAERLRESLSAEQNAALDAEILARHVLGWNQTRWITDARSAAPPAFAQAFESLVARRAKGEPIAYITRTREFWCLDFDVNPAVLIPRPETEILVEQALMTIDWLAGIEEPRKLAVADVGTGSGCVAIALAHNRPSITVIATDISRAALEVARRNARRHGVANRITFQETSMLDGVGAVDLVVSNPPYIAAADAGTLMRDVRDFEPHTALFSGGDGLDAIRQLLAAVRSRNPVPPLLFEFGGAAEPVRAAVEAAGLRLTGITSDFAGLPRVAHVEG